VLQQTKKNLDAKKAECESLHYRLKVLSEQEQTNFNRQNSLARGNTAPTREVSNVDQHIV